MATFDITTIVQSLHDARHRWRQEQSRASEPGGREFPSRDALAAIIDSLKGVLFPMRLGPPDLRQESEDFHVAHALDGALHALLKQVRRELKYNAGLRGRIVHDAGGAVDHGTGVVIGETAVIGARVRSYQAVTLGAKRFPTDADGNLQKGLPRHPVVEDDVVIYAGATVLGLITIGKGAIIGGNVWLTHDVPPGGRIAQAESRVGAFANGIAAA